MKIILTEKQIRRFITEDRSYQIMSSIELLDEMINNFDIIDCKDDVLIYDNRYVKVYCDKLYGATLDELKDIKKQMEDELTSLINQEFRNKISW